ncbi:hypothetical protein GCM10010495_15740 [Kitasatospora herbaricolor]|uniref:hypothetical protein n=1 Tax=Kitasatospora herbaricolor TaxID=68217 RepID=UPI001749A3FF|nr:hypothetical protein [Kitasatospora herbaricolor]MDQ0308033.1 hypothetical protein [Kitasatospora herbaricolor]GGV05032.1 hypothetical protein GCM10010495_15740 [Kitasatospora herbaricolor]
MSDTLSDTTSPDSTGHGGARHDTGASTAADSAHGRHRGTTAPDDNPQADAHGRHRLAAERR